MLDYFKTNYQTYFIYFIWLVTGIIGGTPLAAVVIPLTVLLLKRRGFMLELFIGFLFILILSDSRHMQLGFAANVKTIYILLLGVILLDKKMFAPYNKFYLAFVPFFFISAICIFNSPTYFTAIQKTFSYFLLLLVVPNFVSYLMKEYGDEFFKGITTFIAFMLCVGIALKVAFPHFVSIEGRYAGVLGNPNGMGLFCFLAVVLYRIIKDVRPGLFSRKENIFFYGLLFLTVILTGSRATLACILLFFGFTFFYKMSPFLGFFILLAAIGAYELVMNNLFTIITFLGVEEFFRLETLESGSGRIIAWQFAWNNIQDHMFLGRGFAFTEYLYHKHYHELSMLGHQGNAHSSYLTFWLDTGLVGVLAYFVALVAKFLQAVKNSKLAMPMLYAVVFSIYFESWLTASLNPFTITMLIGLVLMIEMPKLKKEEDEESTVPVH